MQTALNKVFVIIYKNGVREFFSKNEKIADDPVKNEKKMSTPLAILENKDFKVKLLSIENVPDKKNKRITLKAGIDVYYNDEHFDQLTLIATQEKAAQLDYANINGRYYNKSSVRFEAAKLSGILFEKYERFNGKGYGWALPPDFFDPNTKYCSVAFLIQKGFQREQNWGGGIKDVLKIDLQNCSSLEFRLLSVALAWLGTNFIK